MHVPIRDRDDSRRDAFARYVDCIRIGARLASGRVQRERNLAVFRRLAKEIEDDWRDDGTAGQNWSAIDRGFPILLLLDSGVIDGKRHIDHDRHLRTDARRADARAPTTVSYLLLRRGDGHDFRRAGLRRVSAQRLEHDEGADTVVDRPRDDPAIRKFHGARIDHPRVTDGKHLLGFLLGLGAEIDPDLGELRRLLSLVGLDQMDRLLFDDAEYVSLAPN